MLKSQNGPYRSGKSLFDMHISIFWFYDTNIWKYFALVPFLFCILFCILHIWKRVCDGCSHQNGGVHIISHILCIFEFMLTNYAYYRYCTYHSYYAYYAYYTYCPYHSYRLHILHILRIIQIVHIMSTRCASARRNARNWPQGHRSPDHDRDHILEIVIWTILFDIRIEPADFPGAACY
jgi:hypothetical protein